MNKQEDVFPEGMIDLLPEDNRFYLYLSVAGLMAFPDIADHLIEEFEKKESYKEFVQKSGIEPLKDVNVIALSNDRQNGDKDKYAFIVSLKSSYDREKLMSHFKEEEDGRKGIFVSTDGDEPVFLIFIKKLILAFSNSRDVMESIIEKKDAGKKKTNTGIFSSSIDEDTIFGCHVGLVNKNIDDNIFNIPLNLFQSLEFVSFFLESTLDEGFLVTCYLAYADKEYIHLVGNLFRSLKRIFSKQVKLQDISEFLENIEIEDELDGIKMLLYLTKENVDALFGFLKEKKILEKKGPASEEKAGQGGSE
ncbi:MAG: hypothetical protein JW969_05745 [Spirochaetales bacterium]|nr:hypothetical protein [Spirochaetales bacterium]